MTQNILLNKKTDFTLYSYALGESFAKSLQHACLSFSLDLDDSIENTNWAYISSFLKFICEDHKCDSIRTLLNVEKNESVITNYEFMTWQIALSHYRQHIDAKDESLYSKQDKIIAVRLFFCDHCSTLGLIPKGLVIKGWIDEANLNANSDDFVLIFNHRKRDFNPYRNDLGDLFTLKLVDAYTNFSNDRVDATEVTYWHHIADFLRFVCESDLCKPLRTHLNQSPDYPIKPNERYMVWQSTLLHYRHFIDTNKASITTKTNTVHGVRQFFCEFCANFGLIPHDLSLKGWRLETKLGVGSTFIDDEVLAILGKTKDEFTSFIEQMDNDGEDLKNGVSRLIRSLFDEGSSEGINKVQLTTNLLSSRLNCLKSHVSKVYFKYIQATQELDEWISNPAYHAGAERFERILREEKNGFPALVRDKCLSTLKNLDVFGAIVVWLRLYCDFDHITYTDDRYEVFYRVLKHFGWNQESFELHLGKSSEGMAAAFTLMLLETAANPQSIVNLTINDLILDNCIEGTYSLNWMKLRSIGSEAKTKRFELRNEVLTAETITVKDVFEHQLKCRDKSYLDVKDGDQEKLFLTFNRRSSIKVDHDKYSNVACVPGMPTFSRRLTKLSKICSDGDWTSTPKAVRGSLLLLEGLLTKDFLAVAELGQHTTLAMARKYTNHLPEKIRVEEKIRGFLNWFEALLTVDIENFAQKIGVDEALYAKNREEAQLIRDKEVEQALNQQFGGIHCADPYAGTHNIEQKGSVCTEISNCPSCPQRRGVFLATEGNVINIMHWHQSLEDAKVVLSDEAFAPWLLWYSFTTRILERLKNSREHRMLFKISERKSQQQSNSYQSIIKLVEVN